MSTYCIADIHGCYEEFMELLDRIQFNPKLDTLYVLGDAIDKGDRSLDCLRYIMRTKRVHLLLGNHEDSLLFLASDAELYERLYGSKTFLHMIPEAERSEIYDYIRTRPLYKTFNIDGNKYFLSHAGLDVSKPFNRQTSDDLLCIRQVFYGYKALSNYTVIFGHTPTFYLRSNNDCSVWYDEQYHDKICIDCGCAFGGALAAFRLEDKMVFHVKSNSGYNPDKYTLPHGEEYSLWDKIIVPLLEQDKGNKCQ